MIGFAEKYGPWAVVTGASAGIGRAIAGELARRKLNLVVIARRAPLLEALKQDLEATYGVRVAALPLDLASADALSAIERATADKEVGLVVPVAGAAWAGPFAACDAQQYIEMAQLNMVVPMRLVHLFAGPMIARKRGGILLVSSLFAYQGVPYFAHYAATKAYVLLLGEALHQELRRYGVDVTVLAPGLTRTDMPARLPIDFSKLPMAAQSPTRVAKAGITALGRTASVVPGLRNKLFAWQNRIMPRATPVWLFEALIRRAFTDQAPSGEMNLPPALPGKTAVPFAADGAEHE